MDYLFLPSGEILEDFIDCSFISARTRLGGDNFFILQVSSPPSFLRAAFDNKMRFDLPRRYVVGRYLHVYGYYFDLERLLADKRASYGFDTLWNYGHYFLYRPQLSSYTARAYWISLLHASESREACKALNAFCYAQTKPNKLVSLDISLNVSDFATVILDAPSLLDYGPLLYELQNVKTYFIVTRSGSSYENLAFLNGFNKAYAPADSPIKPAMDLHALFQAKIIFSLTSDIFQRLCIPYRYQEGYYYSVTNYGAYHI